MMAPPVVPSEGDINTLQEFIGVTRAQATILLEKYRNVEQAMNQYFEDPTRAVKPQLPPNQWEHADNLPSFRIDADDTNNLGAMSRPPSRIDNSNPVTDMGTSRFQTETGMHTPEEMQDQDLQRAIAMSKQEFSDQEMGVVESSQQFGPANRPYYDANQWAMTTVASSREIVEHPPPTKRQRISAQPAFLRGSSETGYLAPLLNIYHNIPLARESFLLPSMRVFSYGYDPQWWSGASDENTKSISVESSDQGSQDRHNLLAEIQCLMAFLDDTNRAYGSVDALRDLRALNRLNSDNSLKILLESWVEAAMLETRDNQLTQIFTSTAMKSPGMEGYSPEQKDLVCLEPTVRRAEGQTLVNLLDSTIWDDMNDKVDDIWIHQCAEIFTVRLYDPLKENKGLGLEIPAVWYPDRYMYEYREVTRQWRQEMLAIRYEINQCMLAQRRCEFAQGPAKRVIKIRDVLEAASKLSQPDEPPEAMDGNDHSNPLLAQPGNDSSDSTKSNEIQVQLEAILRRIDEKLQILEERKRELYNHIKNIASQLTQPNLDSDLSPVHKYHLQGVSTKPNITYMRRQKQQLPNLIDITDESSNEGTGQEFEWWRIVWGKDERILTPSARPISEQAQLQSDNINTLMSGDSIDDSQTYAVHVVQETEVLEAAKTESNSVILVYANANAMEFKPSPLSQALRKFIELDNRAFQEEIDQERSGNRRRNSQDTNTTIMEDIPLNERCTTPENLREMTPMSMTSPLRGADGQPSPKRPKSDESSQVYREFDADDEPPPYEASSPQPQMQEKKLHKIGLLADQMLEKYGGDGVEVSPNNGPIHIEHSKEPLR